MGTKTSLFTLMFWTALNISSRADIYRWSDGQLIPGTQGITPGPGVQLDHRELVFAQLSKLDLTGSHFEDSNLSNAKLHSSTLTQANLSGANLSNASLADSTPRPI